MSAITHFFSETPRRMLLLIFCGALGLLIAFDAEPQSQQKSGQVKNETTLSVTSLETSGEDVKSMGSDPEPMDHGTNIPSIKLELQVLDAITGKPISGAEVSSTLGATSDAQRMRVTDDHGRYILRAPLPAEEIRKQLSYASVSVQHPQYAGRGVSWNSPGADVSQMLPNELTLRLEKGISIGGTVSNERGVPIAGVKVLLSGSPISRFPMANTGGKSNEGGYIQKADEKKPASVTDIEGKWTISNFPSDLENVEITLIRPAGGRDVFATRNEMPFNQRPLVSLEDLRAGKARFVLKDGVTVHGIVVDENGNPVPNAQMKEGYGHVNIIRTPEFVTGSDGRFERPHRFPRQWIYTASAPGRAISSIVAQVQPEMPEVKIVMPPAKPLRMQVVDASGKPVSGADIRVDTYRTEAQILDWKATTDTKGKAIWTNAPATPVTFFVTGTGATRKFKAAGGDPEQRIELAKSEEVTLHIRAVDSTTKVPVKIRKVGIRKDEWMPSATIAEPNTNEFSVTIRRNDFGAGTYPSYGLKLQADGYEHLLTRYFDHDEGNLKLDLELKPGTQARGIVLQPGGDPAATAKIWMASGQNGESLFCNAPGRFYGDRLTKAEADENGKFELPSMPDNTYIIFTHKSGFLQTTFAAFKAEQEAHLEEWGRVEGRITVAGEPKPGKRISLSSYYSQPNTAINAILSTQSDTDGSFVFSEVPPGEYKLYRQSVLRIGRAITESHPIPVTIKPGENPSIKYETEGRPVVGQAVSDPPDAEIDWMNDDHSLVLEQAAIAEPDIPNREDFATFAAFREANEQSRKSGARLARDRAARTYVLDFEKDGSFRVDGVPPGSYELRIRVTKPTEQNRPSRFGAEEELGSLKRQLMIAGGNEPLDLGTIVVPIRETGSRARAASPTDFHAQTFEGKILDLTQFKGKHVLLAFWAEWSESSQSELANLKELRNELASDGAVEIVGVNIDDELETGRKAAKEREYAWRQTWVPTADRARLTSTFDVEQLPDLVLIGPDGRIIARDLKGERLRATVKRALAKKAK